jgi:thiamine pyrophosphate-dependent acetolactate synthase large subunit-like protein
VKLAAAYGIRGVRVADGAKLGPTIARAVKSKSPTLVEVVVDREAEA